MSFKGLSLLGLGVFATLAAAETVTVYTVPASDGYLMAKETAPVMEQVVSTVLDSENNQSHSLLAGKIWRNHYKTILEFPLPEKTGTVKSARLKLPVLGNSGGYERAEGGMPELRASYYLAPQANGQVELGDDQGGTPLPQPLFPEGAKVDQAHPGVADVTAAVREAIAGKAEYLGFRLEAPGAKNACWRLVSAENQFNKNNQLSPALIIEFEE